METKINYAIVGVFVLVLVSCFILAVIWLSSGFTLSHYKLYKVYMKESVSGLNLDSPVEYNGVHVGTVKSIELNQTNPQWVELLLNIKSETPITQGTRATLNSRGLTGIAFIGLQDKGTDTRPLIVKYGETYPVISTAPSLFLRIDTTLTQLTASFQSLSKSFQALLNPENLSTIKQILANIQNASKKISPVLDTGHDMLRAIETQTIPKTNQAVVNFDSFSQNVSDLSAEIKQNPAILIRGKEQRALGPGER